MAIAPTPNNNLFKGLTFDGVDSRDYGVYISGDAVFNAPERDAEMVEIPGRDGAYVIDNGRFSNIEVTYHTGLFGTTEADFAAGINAFRNALASRKGYCRLEDDYNPNEYRLAVYKSGLDVTPAMLKAGQFDIVFDCKPQRFLTSGETAQSIASGGTLTNPTLFDAHPLLSFEGVGNINLGGQTIQVNDVLLGWITVNNGWNNNPVTQTTSVEKQYTIDVSNLNTGDAIRVGDGSDLDDGVFKCYMKFDGLSDWGSRTMTSSITYGTRDFTFTFDKLQNPRDEIEIMVRFSRANFVYGTSATKTSQGTASYKLDGTTVFSVTVQAIIEYRGDNRINMVVQLSNPGLLRAKLMHLLPARTRANSTKSTLTGTTYVDLDIAEAWMVKSGQTIVSANDHVIIGADVPVLPPGSTEVTYDNTITNFTITPRWWEV